MNENGDALILIVEGNARLSNINRRALEAEGYKVRATYTLAKARAILKDASPDVILLEVKLPDGSGFDLCREIRRTTSAHIIFLTSAKEAEDEMEGLDSGCNDYLRKPYNIEMLRKRVNNTIISRGLLTATKAKNIECGLLTLDIVSRKAFINNVDILLSQKEFSVLLLFAKNKGNILEIEKIYECCWGQSMANDKNAVKKTVSRLRNKIKKSGCVIRSVYAKGYVFVEL